MAAKKKVTKKKSPATGRNTRKIQEAKRTNKKPTHKPREELVPHKPAIIRDPVRAVTPEADMIRLETDLGLRPKHWARDPWNVATIVVVVVSAAICWSYWPT